MAGLSSDLGSSARWRPVGTNVDFSWLLRLGRHRWLCRLLHRIGLISDDRLARIESLDRDIVLWDLSRGIPFPAQTFDCVYHCHVLEHIDREGAPGFIRECYRVLKPGGIIRIVVPDLEQLTRNYLGVLDNWPERGTLADHSFATEEIFDQMVRRQPKIREQQNFLNRLIEGVLVGNTARSGTMHRWMYDRVSLAQLLSEAGFEEVQQHAPATSQVEGWSQFLLDTEPDGSAYKHSSVYVEATPPESRIKERATRPRNVCSDVEEGRLNRMFHLRSVEAMRFAGKLNLDCQEGSVRVLVTGGSGFIGTNLIESCREHCADVLNLDVRPPLDGRHFDHWMKCDILDGPELVRQFSEFQPTHVVHLAARTDLDEKKQIQGYAANIDGTRNVLEAIRRTPAVERAVLTSTCWSADRAINPKATTITLPPRFTDRARCSRKPSRARHN